MGLVCTANNVTFDDIIAQLKASTPAEQAGGDKPRYQFSISSWTPTAKREMSGIDFVSYFQAGEAWVAKAGGRRSLRLRTCAATRLLWKPGPSRSRMHGASWARWSAARPFLLTRITAPATT